MAVGPDIAFAFLLRPGRSTEDAFRKTVEAIRRYRGFWLEDRDFGWLDAGGAEPEDLVCKFNHLGFEFWVGSLDGFVGEPVKAPPHLVLSADADLMTDDGDPDPAFWKAWQNAIALIVAEVDPWVGAFTDTDSLHEFAVRGFPTEPIPRGEETWLLEYFSSDYLKAAHPGKEEAIRAFATRELAHGWLVATLLLREGRRRKLDALLAAR